MCDLSVSISDYCLSFFYFIETDLTLLGHVIFFFVVYYIYLKMIFILK